MHTYTFFVIAVLAVISNAACSQRDAATTPSSITTPIASKTDTNARPAPTPSNKFTPADVAKLKWIEGTWRGMDGDKPFYERYRIEDTAMVVESLKEDGSPDGEPGRFELRNGEFGKGEGDKRSAASEITDSFVQFVPGSPGGSRRNSFRFERQSDGTWIALLEWPATADKPAQQKVYKMEPWQPKK